MRGAVVFLCLLGIRGKIVSQRFSYQWIRQNSLHEKATVDTIYSIEDYSLKIYI